MLKCHPMVSFGEPLGHVITLRGHILVSRTDDDFFLFSFVLLLCVWCVGGGRKEVSTFKTPSVCRFKTSPCMPAPRAHVETHVRVVPACTGTFLNLHTGVSQRVTTHSTTKPQPQIQPQRHTTTPTNQPAA